MASVKKSYKSESDYSDDDFERKKKIKRYNSRNKLKQELRNLIK